MLLLEKYKFKGRKHDSIYSSSQESNCVPIREGNCVSSKTTSLLKDQASAIARVNI